MKKLDKDKKRELKISIALTAADVVIFVLRRQQGHRMKARRLARSTHPTARLKVAS